MTKSSTEVLIFRVSVAVLAVTGLGQMPIFKRYYLADIPGLGFLADFYLLHWVHYVAAAVFLFLLLEWTAMKAALYFRQGRRPTPGELFLVPILTILVATGFLRVLKNFPSIAVSPAEAMVADIVHLVAAVFFGLTSLVLAVLRRRQARA